MSRTRSHVFAYVKIIFSFQIVSCSHGQLLHFCVEVFSLKKTAARVSVVRLLFTDVNMTENDRNEREVPVLYRCPLKEN